MQKTTIRSGMLRRSALTAALLAIYGYAPGAAAATNLVVDTPYDLSGSTLANGTVTVNNGGVLTGDGATVRGSAYDLVLVNAGGSLVLDNANLSNDLDSPTGQNGRTVTAKGAGATATLNGATIVISAQSTNPGTDYAHAFTAGVGAADGGHVNLDGGSITASGSKRTVGMQANDGGAIDASNLQITTNGNYGHAIQVYRTPTAAETATHIGLDHVSITTNGATYAVGIQSANKGASVTATDTDIATAGSGSFGVEVFNGATAALVNGSITTAGIGAAGVRVYGGNLGSGAVTVEGTKIVTGGVGASGVLAGDTAEPTSGIASLSGVDIATTGGNAAGIESAFGSSIASTNSTVHTQGDAANGVYAHDGGAVSLDGDAVTTDGNHAYGLYATGAGSTISAGGASVATNGLYGYGVRAENGGVVNLDGGSVTTNNATGRAAQDGDGSRAYALSADGANSSIVAKNGTTINTEGQRAYGAYATNGGHISLDGGSVTTHGFMAYGLYASGPGSTIDADNVAVATSGNVGDGVWAYQGGVVNLSGGSIAVSGEPNANSPHETANGLVAVGGAFGAGTINATGVSVSTRGANSVGAMAGAQVGDSYTSGAINLVDSSIAVQGANAVAASVSYGSSLTARGSTLVSQNGDGITITDAATVTLIGTRVQAAGASLVSNLDSAGQTQDIVIGAGSTLSENNGTLLQVNRQDAGMDGIVNLTLQAGATARGDVIDLDGLSADNPTRSQGGKTNFTVAAGANWLGIVRGINDVSTDDGGSFVDNGGAPIAGNVTGGQDATLVFNNGATIGGSVSTGAGSQATFNGATSIAGNVTGTGATLAFNGPATIGQNVSAVQGQVTFAGPATIGQDVRGSGAAFEFSRGEQTSIGGNVTLDDNASLKGGTTAVPIAIAGDVTVAGGATLGGNLFVQGTLNGAGGIVSPGNSVGTQSYASIASFGSTYKAEVNAAGNSDLVIARTGDIDLSATHLTVAQENGNGGYVLNHDYTIVQTVDGLVRNQFASAQLDDSFANTLVALDPVKYAAKDVTVSLSVDPAKVAAVRAGLSSNQNHTLDGVISVAGRNAAADAALASTGTRSALNALSGEVHASTQSALLDASNIVRDTVSDRLRGGAGAGLSSPNSPLWAQVVGDWRRMGGDGNTARVRNSLGGIFLGGDTHVGAGWRVGGALGYTDGDIKVDDRSSKSDVKSYTAVIYGGNRWATGNGSLDLTVGAAYTRHDIDTRRSVTQGGDQSLKASYHADGTQLFTDLGYAFALGQSASVGPYAGLAWINQHADGFSESGGPAALKGRGQTDNVTTSTLGVRGKATFDLGARTATLLGGIGWRHAAGDVDPKRRLSFIQGNGASFGVTGAPIAQDAVALNVGAEMQLSRNAAMGLSYNGQFGGGNIDRAGSLYLKVAF